MATCATSKKRNLGMNRCTTMPQLFKKAITTAMNFEFTAEEAIDPTFWEAAILAGLAERIFIWPDIKGVESLSEDAVYEETPLSDEFVRPGKYRFRVTFNDGLCTHRSMGTHNGGNQRIIFQDIANNALATEKANGNYAGMTVSLLNTEKLILSDGSVSTKTPVYIVLADSNEIDKSGVLFPAQFFNELEKLTDVDLTIQTPAPTTTTIRVKVANWCDETEVAGLAAADFILRATSDGDVIPITSVAYAEGVYTLTGTAFEDGTLTLRAPNLLTVKAYEAVAPVAVNVA